MFKFLKVIAGGENFCSTCKHLKALTYCHHPHYRKKDYVRGAEWAPMAENVRDRTDPICLKWEAKDE